MELKPVRNCSKYAWTQITGLSHPAATPISMTFGVVALGKRSWRMKNIDYLGNVVYDSTSPAPNIDGGYSVYNGCSYVIRPANNTFLADMFSSLIDYGSSNYYYYDPRNRVTVTNNAELIAAGAASLPADIDMAARFSWFVGGINQPIVTSTPGLFAAFFKPPVLHSLAFQRPGCASPGFQTQISPAQNSYESVSSEIVIPGGYDFLLCYAVPNGYQGDMISTDLTLSGNLRFTLEQE